MAVYSWGVFAMNQMEANRPKLGGTNLGLSNKKRLFPLQKHHCNSWELEHVIAQEWLKLLKTTTFRAMIRGIMFKTAVYSTLFIISLHIDIKSYLNEEL